MRGTIAGLTMLLLAAGATADEKEPAKPNALTAKEIADGWLLLFDGETTFGWTVEGEVTLKDGVITLDGGEKGAAVTTTTVFAPADVSCEVNWRGQCGMTVHGGKANFLFNQLAGDWVRHTRSLKPQGGGFISETSYRGDKAAVGTMGKIPVAAPPASVVGFHAPAGGRLQIRNVKLSPGHLQPIFNGKDLAGWKQFRGNPKQERSKFTVTAKGELNVKDGPGDLQTEAQYDDFILQLDCVSNGKHLNSGIFFRCLPGQYQQGYEAQIRNEWQGADRTKPVDFGTGAIYRRQPARKVASTDGEWFTMTVVAHGNRLATWVNGYPTADWADDRKADENARNGSKTGKGAISIQGHDPTTDLSFRNIRIAELKK